jgi:hypothetical protein
MAVVVSTYALVALDPNANMNKCATFQVADLESELAQNDLAMFIGFVSVPHQRVVGIVVRLRLKDHTSASLEAISSSCYHFHIFLVFEQNGSWCEFRL